MITTIRENYSSEINLYLETQGKNIALAKIGPDYVTLSKPTQLSRGRATIQMSVDGVQRAWEVTIDDAVPFDNRVGIHDIE